jgi:hypothetical protein
MSKDASTIAAKLSVQDKDEVRAFPHVLAGALRSLVGCPAPSAGDGAGSPR